MKNKFFLSLIFGILLVSFVSAVVITDDLHLNMQVLDSGGDVATGTYAFVFNISSTSNCGIVVYTNSTTLTTDSRGIISYYLRNVSLDYNNQYWLCYYRDGSLINTSQIARVPYAFRARNVTLSGVEINQNFNLGSYNITASYLFGNGSQLIGISGTQITNNLNWINASTANGSYYLLTNPYGFWNSTFATFNKTYADTLYAGIAWNYNQTTAAVNQILNFNYYNSTSLPSRISGAGTAGYIPMWNGTTSINNSVIYQLGGKIGIGTSSPAVLLDVRTGVNDSIVASFGVDGNNRISIYDYETGGFRSIYAIANATYGSLNLGHATSPYLFIKTGGNVGVGTANPQEKLEVSGRINASTDVCITGGNCLSDSIMGGAELDPRWTSNYSAYNSSWSSTYNASYVPYTGSNANVVLGDYNFSVGTSDFFVNANTGNVGIGTTTPQQKLHVNGSAVINGTLNMDANKITSLANGTSATDAVTYGQLQAVNASATAAETDPLWSSNYSAYNSSWSSTYNSTYNTWVYNQTTAAMLIANNTFIKKTGDNGTGEYNFNNGWTSGGLTIRNGDLYAQTVYVYNISSLQVSNLNINGSLLPYVGFDNQFDVGSGSLRWNEGYFGGNMYVNGTVYSNNQIVLTNELDPRWSGNYTAYNSSWSSTYNSTYNTWAYNQTTAAVNQVLSYNYWNSTFATFNKTYADTLYQASGSYIPYTGSNANVVLGDYNFSVGTSDFFVNANTGYVGIGTSTPTHTLNVKGEINVTSSNNDISMYMENGILVVSG